MKCLRISGTVVLFSQLLFAGILFAQGSEGNGANQGARQFAATCAGCHGLDGTGSAKGAAITLPRVIALSDADLVRIVRDGVPGKGMPGSQLDNEEIQGVVRYLRTLQGAAASSPAAGIAAKSPVDANPAQPIATTAAQPQITKSEVAAKPTGPALGGTDLIDVQQSDLLQREVKNNWVSYNGDYTGRRYSSMDEVTPANVANLKTRWVFQTSGAGIMEVTPVVVAGVMFITRSNDAWALDAKTGKQLWHHERAVSSGLIDDASGHINRGVAVLGARVYMETDNAHLLCLDARSGSLIWDVAYATGNKNYGATSAPLIVKNNVLVGTSGGDDGVRGFVAAYDAQTGKEVGSSRVDLQACKLEYSIVSPK